MSERRPWRTVDADLFRFTTTDLRELHIAIMTAFEQASVLAPALNIDQVRAALATAGWNEAIDDDTLQRSLESLTGWGHLEATQDNAARYATPEEFERKNLQWSLTARGEAAVTGVLHALDSLRHVVGLQTAVLDAIGDGLGDLADLVEGPITDGTPPRIHIQLAQVERHLSALVTSVRQFNGHLQRLLRDDATDDGVFADVKRRTVNYLEEYVEDVERPQRRLVGAIERVEELGLATVFDLALVGANLAPVADGDPGPDWIRERARRWSALREWFAPLDAAPPRVNGLLSVARTAIIELLRVLERRWDSRRRSASVANDFRVLARWFSAAPGDADAHRLFAAAFGLWPSRHAHLRAADGEARAPNTSWLDAEPVDVAPALRTTGSLATRGKVHPVADPSRIRAARQREQAAALAAHDELRGALFTPGALRLSYFARLDGAAFEELLTLLAVALDAPLSMDGTRRAVSVDGGVEVILRDPHDGHIATLSTPDGELRCPDLFVSIALESADEVGISVGDVLEEVGSA
jgi:uncharacterized protein (TIGR02677 family)